ncbi:MAG: hypothetical protein P8L45_11975, partial [Longimicrobiales bacterium]|nr:hypothetical protein [Longimicrobiales bacterium]
MTGLRGSVAVVLLASVIVAIPARAQEDGNTVSVSEINLTADTVSIGDLVDLSFVVDLPEGTILFVPDSLDTSNFESFDSVRWSIESQSDGGSGSRDSIAGDPLAGVGSMSK